jgi:hypothetical protein
VGDVEVTDSFVRELSKHLLRICPTEVAEPASIHRREQVKNEQANNERGESKKSRQAKSERGESTKSGIDFKMQATPTASRNSVGF